MNDTTWFWQIVDARGLADVSSDEFVALNELVSKAERLGESERNLSEAREEIERLKGLVAGIRETPQEPWQDIATAPKDGTFVLTCIGDSPWLPAISHWGSYAGVTRWGADPETFMEEDHFMNYWTDCHYEPTHWQPLPGPFEGSGRTLADANPKSPDSDLSSLRKGAEELRRKLAGYAITEEYDFPGDAPEFCGFWCNECKEHVEADGSGHRDSCLCHGERPQTARATLVSGSREEPRS